jgi:uncharacterized protein with HEPN domain
MQRDLLLLGEMIDAAEQIKQLAADVSLDELDARRERRDALLWNYTVLGEAAGQVSDDTKARFPAVAWQQPTPGSRSGGCRRDPVGRRDRRGAWC